MFQPLGLAYVAASLQKHGHEVLIYDANVDNSKSYLHTDPDVIGISVPFTIMVEEAKKVAEAMRRVFPDKPIIFGGPAASVSPEEFYQYGSVVVGEGEEAFPQLLASYSKLPKAIHAPLIEHLDDLPFPAV